jgi:hypothetical protein
MSDEAARYATVIEGLRANGCHAEFHRPGQLVVCRKAPVLAGRIWITWRDRWFVSTWAPAVYAVPEDTDIVALCVACVNDKSKPFYRIPGPIVQQFQLRLLDGQESDDWFSLWDDDE